eukprot:TRINITY_DN41267_c0_g1_i1.p1 TRINITY_DN41267_c0_g1~~TRINITY_DN41267_c0_g1_i1.p1  ORF type:complete len:560 (+),score=87.61 TRINITY_DN41267_c0_g1_i1:46-1680(+)
MRPPTPGSAEPLPSIASVLTDSTSNEPSLLPRSPQTPLTPQTPSLQSRKTVAFDSIDVARFGTPFMRRASSIRVPDSPLDRKQSFSARHGSVSRAASFALAGEDAHLVNFKPLPANKSSSMIKVFVDMAGVLRDHPLFINVLKDCTVRRFLRNALQKYKADAKRNGMMEEAALTMRCSECAVRCARGEQTEVLALELDSPLLEQLAWLFVPYPFVLTIVVSPDVLLRRELAAAAEREKQRLEEERVRKWDEFTSQAREVEVFEVVTREDLARVYIVELEAISRLTVEAFYSELLALLALQIERERVKREDILSDQRFFEHLQVQQQLRAKAEAEEMRQRHSRYGSALKKLSAAALDKVERLKRSERCAWEVLQVMFSEWTARVHIEGETSFGYTILALSQAEQRKRITLGASAAAERKRVTEQRSAEHLHLLQLERRHLEAEEHRRRQAAIRDIIGRVEERVERRAEFYGTIARCSTSHSKQPAGPKLAALPSLGSGRTSAPPPLPVAAAVSLVGPARQLLCRTVAQQQQRTATAPAPKLPFLL